MTSPTHLAHDIALSPAAGTFGILLLYGMTLTQAYQYYTNYRSDGFLLKGVGLILILESLHLALACHYVYYYVIQHWGETEYLVRIVWSIFLSGRIGFVVAWLVNMFFVVRIYILSSKNIPLSFFIAALSTVRPVFGFAGSAYASTYPKWADFADHAHWLFVTGLAVGLVGDFLIALGISYYLLKARDISIPSTRNILNLLLWYTVNTTAILTLFAVIEMIYLVVEPRTLAFFGFFQIQIQLYANCFLTTLNARQNLRRDTPVITSLNVTNILNQHRAQNPPPRPAARNDAVVSMVSECENPANFSSEKVNAV